MCTPTFCRIYQTACSKGRAIHQLLFFVVQISLKLFWSHWKKNPECEDTSSKPLYKSIFNANPFIALCFPNQKTKPLGCDKYLDVLFLYICKGVLALNSNIFHVSRMPCAFERTYNSTFANEGTLLTITHYLKSQAYKERMHDSWTSRKAAPICRATLDRTFS